MSGFIVGQGIKKIDIPGFGSCLVHDHRGPNEQRLMNAFADWTFTYNTSDTLVDTIDSDKGEEAIVIPESGTYGRMVVVENSKVPEVLRCGCGAEGQYWGMRLAFPLPLCFTCLKKEHKKEALPKVGLWRRVWRFLTRKRT